MTESESARSARRRDTASDLVVAMELRKSGFDFKNSDSLVIPRALLYNKARTPAIAVPPAIAAPSCGLNEVVGIMIRAFAVEILVPLVAAGAVEEMVIG